jgi:hypothetical protein
MIEVIFESNSSSLNTSLLLAGVDAHEDGRAGDRDTFGAILM